MVPGLVTAEIQPRGEGHMLGFQKVPAEVKGVTTERLDIGI